MDCSDIWPMMRCDILKEYRYFLKKITAFPLPDNSIMLSNQNIVAINHFKNEAYIFAHCYES